MRETGTADTSAALRNGKGSGAGRSVAVIVLVWLVLQVGGMFAPGLLDDVDSVYIEIAREMLHRHDYVTPFIDGVRFFDKPPLMYWLAAGSMRVFGEFDWAARLPLALAVLALLLAVYELGRRFFGERGGFYSALVMATSVGPYLYTRFFIPDILICLWMTVGVWLFLVGLDAGVETHVSEASLGAPRVVAWLGFGAVLGLNLLTKGLIGLVFPVGFCLLYLLVTRQWRFVGLRQFAVAIGAFVAVGVPWHVLVWLRNPAVPMPAGVELPARAGWAWFYLYNEHVARFLGKRVPHDYGNTPVWLFLLYAVIWVMPWAAFLPAAVGMVRRGLGHRWPVTARQQEAALAVTLWAGIVLVFFSISSRQEYYSLPALPALALMLGGILGAAEIGRHIPGAKARFLAEDGMSGLKPEPILEAKTTPASGDFGRWVLACHKWGLVPVAGLVAGVCGFFAVAAPAAKAGVDLSALLASNPEMYNLSLGHLFDLTGAAMGLFRGPLAAVAVGMLVLGPVAYWVRRRGEEYGANLLLAGGMTVVLLAAHEGLVRFNPILGSKGLAEAIVAEQRLHPAGGDTVLIDGELTAGSTLLFYTRQPVGLVDGRVNGPWFGGFWPDAPAIFWDDARLRAAWSGAGRVFLLTYQPEARQRELAGWRVLASAGGKTVLVNR